MIYRGRGGALLVSLPEIEVLVVVNVAFGVNYNKDYD